MRYLALVALLFIGCAKGQTGGPVPSAIADDVPEATVKEPAVDPVAEAASNQERDLQIRLDELTEENMRLKFELADVQAEAEKYRQGLQEAVDQLNRNAANQQHSTTRITPSAISRSKPRRLGRVSTLGSPYVQILGDQINVTGKLYNSGDEDASGSVELELLCNGQSQGTGRVGTTVYAGTDQSYSHTFRHPGRECTYSARARLVF